MSHFVPTPPPNETRLHVVAAYLENRGWIRFRRLFHHPDTLWRDPRNYRYVYDVDAAFFRQAQTEKGNDIPPRDKPEPFFIEDDPNETGEIPL